MGDKRTGRDDYEARCQRIEEAQRELAPAREYSGCTPAQRADNAQSDVLLTDEQLDRIEAAIEKLEQFAEYLVAKAGECDG